MLKRSVLLSLLLRELRLVQAMTKFYQQIYSAVTRHFDFDQLKVVIIASPGFTKEAVLSSIMEEATVSLPFYFYVGTDVRIANEQ